jgi:hypothetical protein
MSEINDSICFMRFRTNLLESIVPLAETPGNNQISLCAYAMLGEISSDEYLKELKITTNLCAYFFCMLEHAWNNPSQKFQRLSVQQLLRGKFILFNNQFYPIFFRY